jgi:hypothetical protein
MEKAPNPATRHVDRTGNSLVTKEANTSIMSSKSKRDVATQQVAEPKQVEVLPPNHSRGEIVPFETQLERNRLVRKERLAWVSDLLNLVGLKVIGVISLTACLYEAFYPGAPQTLLSPAQLLAIAGACLAGPQLAEFILGLLAIGGEAASQELQKRKHTRQRGE